MNGKTTTPDVTGLASARAALQQALDCLDAELLVSAWHHAAKAAALLDALTEEEDRTHRS
jgi:hypothetical protein